MENEKELFPLSYSQQNIWNLEQAYPGLPLNNICTSLYIEGNFRVDLLQKCIELAYIAYPVLRTRITRKDGKILQYISDEMPVPASFIDFSKTNQRGVSVWNRSVAKEHLPLYDSDLCRMIIFKLSEHEGGILTRVHHMIADAWSQATVTNHIIHNYFHLLQEKETDCTVTPDYRLHVQAEQDYMASRGFARDCEFWKKCLKDVPSTHIKEYYYAKVSPVGVRHSVRVSSRMNRMIASFCEQKKVSPFAVFYMGIVIYLARMKNQTRSCIGVPTINRLNYQEKQSGGMFVNTLPFVNEIDTCMSFNQFNDKLKNDWFQLLYHQRMPFEEIKKILIAQNDQVPEQLFGIALSYQNGKMDHLRGARVRVEGRWIYSGYQAEALCVHLSSRDVQNQFLVDYDYLTQIFSEDEIVQFHGHLMQILKQALLHPDLPIRDLDIIGEEEEERLIFTFNQTSQWYQRDHSLKEELAERAEEFPDRVALIWNGERTTYRELHEQAWDLARRIAAAVPGKEKTIGICMERSSDLFILMCAVAYSGHAWLLLDQDLPEGRIRMMLEESDAALCICGTEQKEQFADCVCRAVTSDELHETASLPEEEMPKPRADYLAYLVYTSGSTGKPKAVQIEQRSVINLAENMKLIYPRGAVLSLCNVGFDAFILESMSALLAARTIVIMPSDEINRAGSLAKAILQYDVGFVALTPSRLQAYLKDPLFGKAAGKLECIVCGGESLSSEILLSVRNCSEAEIYNQYGPSETTVAVSHARVTGEGRLTIGKPFSNCRIYILDENLRPLAPGCAGELYIGGDCLARGYLGDKEKTKERFVSDPYVPGERLYRTGDMGEWTSDGEIVFLGRRDRQLKLLGHRIEPGEVEERLSMYPAVRQVAVNVTGNQLAAYYTADKCVDPDELIAYGADYLPRYMLPVYALQLEKLPYTVSGKVDYKKLPLPAQQKFSDMPADNVEETILEIWKKILGKEQIGIQSDYFLSGGDSLNAVAMLADLEAAFGKVLKLEDVYRYSTVKKLATIIRGHEADGHAKMRKAPQSTESRLSAAQQSFYVLEQTDETKKSYHMAGAFSVKGSLDIPRLEGAFRRLLEEEPLFRTGFMAGEDKITARILENVPFSLELVEASSLEQAMEGFVRPFDLAKPPLLRAGVFSLEGQQWLLLDMHHIISDGISSVLVMQRLDSYYRGEKPALPEFTYFDYVWNTEENQKGGEETTRFWEERIREGIPELKLPLDRPRPSVFDGEGGRYYFPVPVSLTSQIQAFCQENRVTVFAFLLSAFAVLLSGVSRQKRFAVGTPLAGRTRKELQNVIGAFVNTLPIIVDKESEDDCRTIVNKMHREVTSVIDHQEISLTELVEMAGIQPERDRNPLYTTLFSLAPLDPDGFALGENRLEYAPQDIQAVKVDLHLEVTPASEGYRFCFEYASSLFDQETIAFYSRCYVHLAGEMVRHPDRIPDLSFLLAPGDRMRLLEQPRYVRTPYEAVCIDRIIDRYAVWKEEEKAVCWGDGAFYTYRQLLERANECAQALVERGVGRGDVVAFLPERNGDMLVTMFAIIKAGAAYLPVDPGFPHDRVLYMLECAKARCLITGERLEFSWKEEDTFHCPVYSFEELRSQEVFGGVTGRTPEDIVNVIYTSGSTGRPKGVMMMHKALANLLAHVNPLMGDEEDAVLCASNCVFDVFTTETLLALACGRRISIADEEEMMIPRKMADRIRRDCATILQLTPSRMSLCLSDETFVETMSQIRILILMGEPWTQTLKDRVKQLSDTKIFNIYGPTETSVYNCQGEIRDVPAIHIGKPIGNCRYYLLDEDRKPVMPTAEGEIYIAGECLAKGYIGRDDLTEEVFVEDPFFPGERMYKTGDVGRLRADGCWQCIGRVDTQLKLNGHRIEPEEIAAQIMESGQAQEAAVMPVMEDGIPQYLCAFVKTEQPEARQNLFRWLSGRLPDYMVPSEIRLVKDLPKTASGKIDYHQLERFFREDDRPAQEAPEDRGQQEEEAAAIPEEKEITEETLKEIWKSVLKIEPDREKSFFEQGGTSLKAILVLNQYYSRKLDLSLNDFYRIPTLAAQAQKLGVGPAAEEKYNEINMETEERKIPEQFPKQSQAWEIAGKTILLTGATGYLGAHLLRELLGQGARKVYCLIRNLSDIRLRETLNLYFGEQFYLENWNRIETVSGDITMEWAGLQGETRELLAGEIDLIIHAAADVRHFAPIDELEKNNVKGTEEMLKLAEAFSCGFVHISTVSVAGSRLKTDAAAEAVFTEESLDIGQNWEENGYAKTKILAEQCVAKAAKRGLAVKVFRVGRLVSRQSDGVFQKNPETNACYRLMRGLLELGSMPKVLCEVPFELTPVDLAAKAVMLLLRSENCVFHIMNPRQYSLDRLLLRRGGMKVIDNAEFDRIIRSTIQGECSEYVRAAAEMWIAKTGIDSRIYVSCVRTEEELKRQGFLWEEAEPEKMEMCLERSL